VRFYTIIYLILSSVFILGELSTQRECHGEQVSIQNTEFYLTPPLGWKCHTESLTVENYRYPWLNSNGVQIQFGILKSSQRGEFLEKKVRQFIEESIQRNSPIKLTGKPQKIDLSSGIACIRAEFKGFKEMPIVRYYVENNSEEVLFVHLFSPEMKELKSAEVFIQKTLTKQLTN
jgi:hypothetical protein